MEQESQKAVLAIDDAATQLSIFQVTLGSRYDLSLVKSAQEALKLMDVKKFDLLLLDIEMPEFSGFDLLHEIRTYPQYTITPVIIISSHSDPDFLAHAKNSSAADVLIKPVDGDQLIEAIEKAFSGPVKKPFGF